MGIQVPKLWHLASICKHAYIRNITLNFVGILLFILARSGKVINQIIKESALTHMEGNNVIRNRQNGFINSKLYLTKLISFFDEKVMGSVIGGKAVYMI